MSLTLSRRFLGFSLLLLLIAGTTSADYYKQSVSDINKSDLGFENARAYSFDSIAGTRCDSESPVVTSNDTIEIVEKTVESEVFTYETKNQCGNRFQIFLSENYVYQLEDNVVRYAERKQNNSFRPYFFSLDDNPSIRYENGNFVILEDEELITSPDLEPINFDYSKFTRDGVSGRIDENDFEFSGELFYGNEDYGTELVKPKAKCKIMDLYTNETLYLEKECIAAENSLVLIEDGQIFDMTSGEFTAVNLTKEDVRDYRLTNEGVFTDSGETFHSFDSEVVELTRDFVSVDWIKGKTLWTDEPNQYVRRINLREMSGEEFCSTVQTENISCNHNSGCECNLERYNQSLEASTSSNTIKEAKIELNQKFSKKLENIEPVENSTANSSKDSGDQGSSTSSSGNQEDESGATNSTSTPQDGEEDESSTVGPLLSFFVLSVVLGIFSAPVGLILFLIYSKYGPDEEEIEDGGEENKPYQDLLEPLSNMPRENIVGQNIGLRRFKAAIDLLLRGSTDYDTRKWTSEDVERLAAKVESKFDENGYSPDEFHLCGIDGYYKSGSGIRGNYLVGVSGQKLLRIELEPEKVGKVQKIKLEEFDLNSGFDDIEVQSRNSSKFDLTLTFDSRERKSNFLSNLKSSLRSSGLSSYKGLWADEEKIKKLKKAKMGAKNNFQNISPYEFEEFVAKLFRSKGYSARVTSKTGDAGIDVIAKKNGEKIAIQAKRHKRSNKVGSPTVQKTLGSMHEINADKSIVVTSSTFTQPAKNRARNAPIELWGKGKIHREIDRHMI
ncbi:hypothetical protein GLU64_01595 [Nanohaloarchaea archaeon]|nr:hypothetical protein [Candidatus Nanohaloarchaea archaeon]